MAVNQENTQYSYEVMAPHESFRGIAVPLVVRTDNPDPDTFRLILKDSEGNAAEACMDDVYDPGFTDLEVRSTTGTAQGGYVFFFTARHSGEYSVYIQEKPVSDGGGLKVHAAENTGSAETAPAEKPRKSALPLVFGVAAMAAAGFWAFLAGKRRKEEE